MLIFDRYLRYEYLAEIEAIFEKLFACQSDAQIG